MKTRFMCLVFLSSLLVSGLYVPYGGSSKEYDYLIFVDDFEDLNLDSWMVDLYDETNPGEWSIVYHDGSNVLSLQGNIDVQPEGISLENCSILVNTKFVNFEPGHISIRISNHESRYFIRFDSTDLRLVKCVDSVVDLVIVECILDPDTWYTFRISCIGDRIKVFVDDILFIDFVDEDPLLSGGVGLQTGVTSHLYFDNFMVFSSIDVYIEFLLQEVENEINNGRKAGYDTSAAEVKLGDAYDAFNEGEYSLSETYAEESMDLIYSKPKEEQDSQDDKPSIFSWSWSIQSITGIITIGATVVGIIGWLYQRRLQERRETILVKRLFEEVDDIYSRFKMNSVKCESELIRLRSEVLKEFKDRVLDEENYRTLDERIELYLKEIRDELIDNSTL